MFENIVQCIFVNPWPFWAGGVIIGMLVPMLYYFFNTALGVSTGYGNFVKFIFPSARLKWIKSKFPETLSWRVFFIVGIILGAFLSAVLSGNFKFTLEMGYFTKIMEWPVLGTSIYFFSSGILLGLGARIAGGCTSGHSIHGIANLHFSSILVTILFLIGGIISTNIIRFIVMGGAW